MDAHTDELMVVIVKYPLEVGNAVGESSIKCSNTKLCNS